MSTLQPTSYTLKMYNKSTIRPLGKTQLRVTNPKNGTTYDTEFIITKKKKCLRKSFSSDYGTHELE
jgi:hypothetical protein